jgi:hypothetical protein
MLLPPTHERTLEEMFDASVRRTPPPDMSPRELENARIVFMQGALAVLWLIPTLAPAPVSLDELVAAIDKMHKECMQFMTRQPYTH